MEKNQKFMERLKEIRKKESLTQVQFCEKIGVTQATLSSYENGAKLPNIDTILTIATACNCSIDWLLGLSDRTSTEIQTVSDVLRLFIKLEQSSHCTISVEKTKNIVLSFDDDSLANLAAEWVKMKDLVDQNIIKQDLFDLWLEKALKESDLQSLSKLLS